MLDCTYDVTTRRISMDHTKRLGKKYYKAICKWLAKNMYMSLIMICTCFVGTHDFHVTPVSV